MEDFARNLEGPSFDKIGQLIDSAIKELIKKQERLIQERLLTIGVDWSDWRPSDRFKRLCREIVDDSGIKTESWYYDDGTASGIWLIDFEYTIEFPSEGIPGVEFEVSFKYR